MARCFLMVMDSVGVGNAPDAKKYGDEGSNTLGHIARECALGNANGNGLRTGELALPFLSKLGFGLAAQLASGELPQGLQVPKTPLAKWGCAAEISSGKDTISGHWEIAGLPVLFDWGYFTSKENSFPQELIAALVAQGNLEGILGNCQASGPEIINKHGVEHIQTGKPICYTSADSVFQIAAHEEHFGLDRLYQLCQTARTLMDPLNIGRIIARPFIGEMPEDFKRTENRRDFSVPPVGKTLLDLVVENGKEVYAIGKISDIYAGQGVTHKIKASGHEALMAATKQARDQAQDGDLVFTNFVDFDMLFGHRRDVAGYANALEKFDVLLKEFCDGLKDDDVVVLTADHGNDPTWHGNDHTREQVPILMYGKNIKPEAIGKRKTFADIGATISRLLKTKPLSSGCAF